MRLKRALSQIRPTEGQREKMYGDVLDKLERLDVLDKLSEEPPEKEKETRVIMEKRKILTSMAAALAAVVIVGGTVYAASPEVRETVNNILGINRQSTEEFYEIQKAEGANIAGFEAIEDAVTVTENGFTKFAEGIWVKLVSVTNNGSFAELLLEFELDEPLKDDYYLLNDVDISNSDALLNYSISGLGMEENGRTYAVITLRNIEDVPANSTYHFELKSLLTTDFENVIEGYYSTDFTIDTYVKSYSVNIEPTEIFWTDPFMLGETAHMEISGLSYNRKAISFDLRMLEDCLVSGKYEHGAMHGECRYLNSTTMFSNGNMGLGGEFNPLKFKMSNGTLVDSNYNRAISDYLICIDTSSFETDDDWVQISQNIPKDKPAKITFELNRVTDYTDVEAIVFCGLEIPITEKNF